MATRDSTPSSISYSSRVKKVQVLAPNGAPVSTTNPLPVDAVVTVDTMSIRAEMSEASGHDYYVTTNNLGDDTLTISFDAVSGLTLENIIKVENKTQGWIYNTKGATVTTTSILLVAVNQESGYPAPGATDEFEIVYRGTSRFDAIEENTAIPSTIAIVTNSDVGTSAEQLTASDLPCKQVALTARPTNTGYITVGGSSVTAGNGIVLYAADTVIVDIDNVNKLYVIASVNGEDITATYFN